MTQKDNYMFRALLILLIASGSLFGDLQDCFKKAPNKSNIHQMKNIDFIYVINLDQRPEKYMHTVEELAPFGITPYRFSAVNGWELSLEDLNKAGVKYETWMRNDLMGTCYLPEDDGQARHEIMHVPGRNYFCHCLSRGAVGIALSHLSILKDAYESGYNTIWVMEDDIDVIRDPHLISDLILKLDQLVGRDGWDFLFTDQDTKNQTGNYVPCIAAALRPNFFPLNPYKFQERIDISPEFRKIGARYGAYSMIVSRSGMKKMLDFTQDGIFLPYDMEYTLPDDIQLYNVRNDIVSTQPQALSDNGAPNYRDNLKILSKSPNR
jgi:GR25 family glycosyltransferase involved in LPS biosynthesis